jgi:hypothetical protein
MNWFVSDLIIFGLGYATCFFQTYVWAGIKWVWAKATNKSAATPPV